MAARMEALWAAVTKPSRLAAWLGPAEVDGGVGGTVRGVWLPAAGPGTGTITVWDPVWTWEHTWSADGRPAGIIRWDFERDASGSGVLLQHRGLASALAEPYLAWWPRALAALVAHVDG